MHSAPLDKRTLLALLLTLPPQAASAQFCVCFSCLTDLYSSYWVNGAA